MPYKLIAADLDGTLLSSSHMLPPRLFPLIEQLHERGVRFAPASGRQYYNLREMFAPVADELVYISENGAMLCDGARLLSFSAMPEEEVCRAVQTARDLPGVRAILAGEQGAIFEQTDDSVFLENMALYYARRGAVPDLMEAARAIPVCKVALFCKNRAEEVLIPALEGFLKSCQVALSGRDWVDLMRPGVNKGVAIETLCGTLGILPQECIAFGDYLNDLELLQAAGCAYAMENGHPALKELADHICPSNDEDGVCRALCQIFDIDIA